MRVCNFNIYNVHYRLRGESGGVGIEGEETGEGVEIIGEETGEGERRSWLEMWDGESDGDAGCSLEGECSGDDGIG